MTNEFDVGTYQITTQDCRPKTTALFKSFDEIQDHVAAVLDPGVYLVHRVLPDDHYGTRETEFFGEFTKHQDGKVTYSPTSTEP
jgi:hypothetical protein